MASKLLLITVFVFYLIAFGLAVAAEQRKSIAKLESLIFYISFYELKFEPIISSKFSKPFTIDASVAGSLLTLEAQGPVQLVFFIIAEVCLLAGSVENSYHTKYMTIFGETIIIIREEIQE
uniref:Uncharacterized protein n=1 Tax=Glycine max TaxID=3847 RepID=I1MXI0_SOYBN